MYKLEGVLCALLLCFARLASYGQDSPLKVELKPAHTTVNNYQPFQVATAIRNTGAAEQLLDVWSCSYSTQWISDNPNVHLNLVVCKKNDLIHLKVESGKDYEKPLSIRVELPAGDGQPESVTFRMGFKNATFVTGQPDLPIWSDPVTITVTK
jgi:hypothetical protein